MLAFALRATALEVSSPSADRRRVSRRSACQSRLSARLQRESDANRTSTMICTACGYQIPGEWTFCGHCGQRIPPERRATPSSYMPGLKALERLTPAPRSPAEVPPSSAPGAPQAAPALDLGVARRPAVMPPGLLEGLRPLDSVQDSAPSPYNGLRAQLRLFHNEESIVLGVYAEGGDIGDGPGYFLDRVLLDGRPLISVVFPRVIFKVAPGAIFRPNLVPIPPIASGVHRVSARLRDAKGTVIEVSASYLS